LLVLATLIIGVYVAVSTIVMIVACWGPLPIEDSWTELVSGRDVTWSWLISQHNEHRLLFSRLISIADYWLSAETNVIDFVAGILILASFGVLVVRVSRGAGLLGWVETAWATGLTLALLFWSVQYHVLIVGPFFVQFFGVLLAAAVALSVLALGLPTITTLAIVIGLEFVAAYVMASGVIVPFVAIALAIWLDRPRSHIAVLSVTAVSVVISYLIGYHNPPYPPDSAPLDAPSHLGSILAYTVTYLGGPFGESIGWLLQVDRVAVAVAAGGVGIMMFTILGWRLLRMRRSASPHEALLFALAGFVIAGGLLTSFGRVGFGMESALSSRYATQVLPFWLILSLLGAGGAIGSRRRRLAVMALALPVLIVIAVSERHFAESARRFVTEKTAAAPALLADVADPLLARLYPWDADIPLQKRPMLQRAHTSIFSEDWASWIGTRLVEHAVLANAGSCQGSFDKAVSVSDKRLPGWRAVGRVWSTIRRRAPHKIVLVDGAGLITGYGLGDLGLDAETNVMSAPENGEDTRWIGAFTGGDPGSVTAYALIDAAPTACLLGTARKIVRLVLSNIRPANLHPGGHIDLVSVSRKNVTISGWGMLSLDDNRPADLHPGGHIQVVIDTNLPVKWSNLTTYARPDVVSIVGDSRLAHAGIFVNLDLDKSLPPPDKMQLCVWTDDPEFGRHLLYISSQPGLCPSDGR
jgi:hypothetical protein